MFAFKLNVDYASNNSADATINAVRLRIRLLLAGGAPTATIEKAMGGDPSKSLPSGVDVTYPTLAAALLEQCEFHLTAKLAIAFGIPGACTKLRHLQKTIFDEQRWKTQAKVRENSFGQSERTKRQCFFYRK